MSDHEETPEQSSAKIYSINQFISLIKEKLKSTAKSVNVLFKLDSIKMSSCGVMYMLPLIYKLDEVKPKTLNAKKFNEMVDMNCVFINLRDGLMKKIKKLDFKYFALRIDTAESAWEENLYHQTSISFIKDKETIERINQAENELNIVSEFKL
jgi:hypothetical protein